MGCDGKGLRTKSNNHNFKNANLQKPSWGGWISAYIYSTYGEGLHRNCLLSNPYM